MNRKTKKLNKENGIQDQLLDGEYEAVMTDMVCYLRGADITEYHVEEIRRDLLEMFIDAKQRKEDIVEVIGEDYQTFCDHILENVPKKTVKQKIIDVLSTILLCLGILFAINVVISKDSILMIKNIVNNHSFDFNVGFTLGDLFSMICIIVFASVFVHVICKKSFSLSVSEKNKINKKQDKKNMLIVIISTMLFSLFVLLSRYFLDHIILFTMPIYIYLVIVVLSIACSYVIVEFE